MNRANSRGADRGGGAGAELLAEAQGLLPGLTELRRDLHRHPELGGKEQRTAGRIAEHLRRLGLEVHAGVGGHGVVGLLRTGTVASRPVALRADIDALPVDEASEVPYRSAVPGVSHACGHDGHTAIQLGAAELLCRHAAELQGEVLFLFQPCEDTLPGGAQAMIRDGALRLASGGLPRALLSLHLYPLLPQGTVAVREGWVTCSSLSLRLIISGKGGHVAEAGRAASSPLLPAAALITAAEDLRRELAAEAEPLVLAFGAVHGGTADNVIPPTVELAGSLRTPSPEMLQEALRRLRELALSISAAAGAGCELSLEPGYPPVFNDPDLSARFRKAAAEVAGSGSLLRPERALATGDDVAFFHREAPGVYWQLGSGDPVRGFGHPLHSPRFDFDETLLALGAAVQAHAARVLLAAAG